MREMYINKENKKIFEVLGTVMNATNNAAGQSMILYKSAQGLRFVQEATEFNNEFERYDNIVKK